MPNCQPHAALPAEHGQLAEFVIAEDKPGAPAKLAAQFAETFGHAFPRRRIAHAHEACVAGIITVGHEIIGLQIQAQETVELPALRQRMAHPIKVPVKRDQSPEQGTTNGA
jgi:hypothetical protein